MFLIRHSICKGDLSLDPGITKEGIELIRKKAKFFVNKNIRIILHSPKRRCVESAMLIYELTNACAMYSIDKLREIHPSLLYRPIYPQYYSEYSRAVFVTKNIILPNFSNPGLIIISHRNLLNFSLRYIGFLESDDFFNIPCAVIDCNNDKNKRCIVPLS